MDVAKNLNAFVEEMSASMGAGAAVLTLQTTSANYSQGAEVTGTLLLEGGVVAQHIESLVVKLQEYRKRGRYYCWETLNEVMLAVNLNSEPGQTQKYAFRLPIPQAAFLSPNPYSAQVAADADILWAVNPRMSVFVTITPQSEIMTLDTAMQQSGFLPRQSNFAPMYGPESSIVSKSYQAPDTLHTQITGATLELSIEAEHVSGHLMLNHAETKLKDFLRAAMGEDKQYFPIKIATADLQGEAGAANAGTMLKEMLNQALILPNNEANWMLRASSPPPETGETLLRAAYTTLETNPE